jgi:hypothetical protein
MLTNDELGLNHPKLNGAAHLNLLRTGSIGGILLVTYLFDTTGPTTESFITILVAPSMATYAT